MIPNVSQPKPPHRIGEALEIILERGRTVIVPGQPARDTELMSVFRSLKTAFSQAEVVQRHPSVKVDWSAGIGRWSRIPWMAFLDGRETTSTKSGVYCVFLFRQDMSGVYLTFAQGVTEPKSKHGDAEGREWVRRRARDLRSQCASLRSHGFSLDEKIDLRTDQGLGKDYEASTIAYKFYPKNEVPFDDEILADLRVVLSAYETYLLNKDNPIDSIALDCQDAAKGSSTREHPTEQFIEITPDPEPTPTLDLATITNTFATALEASHLHIAPERVRAFIAALTTKRLAILTGLSGSGKTQIALRFGQWLGKDRYHLEPVRPDWTGPEALLGYEDALITPRGAWHVPAALKFILRAANDPQNPYLLILDEMNLAHVERYFADILSGMESDEPVIPNLEPGKDGLYRIPADKPEKLPFPRNLFVVGTVNVDETTYMFSPKVLDRANTFEFRVEAKDLKTDLKKPKDCPPGDLGLVRGFLEIARDDAWQTHNQPNNLETYTDHLKHLHTILAEGGFEFGHRVFYEAIRFAAMLQSAGNEDINHALDLQIMQKLLPRLHGTRRHLEPVLTQLKTYCADKYPLSHSKIERMIKRVQANQFASFAE